MAWEPTPIEDGDTATAATITGNVTSYETWVNDLGREAFRRAALGTQHGGGLLFPGTPGVVTSEGENQTYDFATFGAGMTYTTYGADNGGWIAGDFSGDRAIAGHPSCAAYTGSKAYVDWTLSPLFLGVARASKCSAILVLWNVEVVFMVRNAIADMEVMTCIQWRDTAATGWFTVNESESFMSLDDHKNEAAQDGEFFSLDIPVATLITADMITDAGLDPAVVGVDGVRAMVSLRGAVAGTSFTIHRWRLTAIPLYTSDPE